MYKTNPKIVQRIVEHYFNSQDSLQTTAAKFNCHYQSVFKWVKLYREKGLAGLFSYKRPHNRAKKELEEILVQLKENHPAITLREAKEFLEQKGMKISINGIWCIWKRYGYAGFNKENLSYDSTEAIEWSREVEKNLEYARIALEKGKVKEAASILNSLPIMPKDGLLLEVPESLLNLRRRVERVIYLFGKVPLPDYIKTLESLYQECKDKGLDYSAFKLGLTIANALSWSGRFQDFFCWVKRLRKVLDKRSSARQTSLNFSYSFSLLILEGFAFAHILKVKKAFGIARKCAQLLKRKRRIFPYLMADLAVLYITLEDYPKAEYYILQSIDKVKEDKRKRMKYQMALYIYFTRGEQQKANQLLKEAEIYDWAKDSTILRFRALLLLVRGLPSKALFFVRKALEQSKKGELGLDIINGYLLLACVYLSLGERTKAKKILLRLFPYVKKDRFKRLGIILKFLLDKKSPPKESLMFSTIKLAWLLKYETYQTAYNYARNKGIIFYFYRYLFFFPEIVLEEIEKGRPVYLPKTILSLPIFNKKALTYDIKFLGKLLIYRNQKYLNTKLQPKDMALLIHLATKASEPNKTIRLNELYANFWPKSQNPSRNFSHLLVRTKKALKIPSYYLDIGYSTANPMFVNRNLYFTTDYQEFEQILAQAKALERAGEWDFARKEYLRAFKLFRGEPFKKMYDQWSENMRHRILNQLETEAIHFAKYSLKHGNKNDARKVLEKVLAIIPDSDEIKEVFPRGRSLLPGRRP